MTRMHVSIAAALVLTLTAVLVLSLMAALPGSASAKELTMASVRGTLADRIMHQATMRMTHDGPGGLNEDGLSIGELMARYDSGEELYIRCGTQARVARILLARHGIRSRLVGLLSASGTFDGADDGHTFMEVWIKHHWIAYDPDGNRQPVDAQGNPMGAVREVQTRPLRWRYIATDPFSEADPNYTYAELTQAVERVMGILVMVTGDPEGDYQALYRGTPAAIRRVDNYPSDLGWTPAGKKRWAKLTRGEA